jgi:hypothetical protein
MVTDPCKSFSTNPTNLDILLQSTISRPSFGLQSVVTRLPVDLLSVDLLELLLMYLPHRSNSTFEFYPIEPPRSLTSTFTQLNHLDLRLPVDPPRLQLLVDPSRLEFHSKEYNNPTPTNLAQAKEYSTEIEENLLDSIFDPFQYPRAKIKAKTKDSNSSTPDPNALLTQKIDQMSTQFVQAQNQIMGQLTTLERNQSTLRLQFTRQ